MEKRFKLILVLTGPLISKGSTGNIEKEIHRSKRNKVSFDVSKNIIEYSKLAKIINVQIYYAAWESDFKKIKLLAKKHADNLKVLNVPEPSEINVDFLQFFSLNFFLDTLMKNSEFPDFYILRIRSDLLLDLNLLISELSSVNSFMHVPHLSTSGKFADFYCAAPAVKLSIFCSNILEHKHAISPKFHYSVILKQFDFLRELEIYQIVIDDILASYFCIQYANENLFPFSIDLHQTCIWRGEKYNKYFYTPAHIHRQWGIKPLLKIELPALVRLEDVEISASFLQGLAFFKKGEFALAETIFKKIIKLKPDHKESLDLIKKTGKKKFDIRQFFNFLL